ncbi:hypothetical protein DFJ67_2961 [Asanoa ferruginea]|uniref:ABC-2 family transporter n=1 Tax=Asanoa ferruginea TaxID=53367 RepID=A0A3D9ZHR8_9ACTN|nr:hypothetical protein [Asanoa ferruginea]REF96966.1 hypothetical protein DFJ67_2961 [Asanoa ferruginea]GIF50156.1 membrane protein [Asanoa ferruginea]
MPRQGRPPLLIAVLIGIGIVVAQALLVPLFAAPATHLGPRDLPVVVAGPAPTADALAAQLPPDAFDITRAPDAAAADALLRDHEAYAAFVIGPTGPAVHTASGASPTVAQLVGQAAASMNAPVTDVAPGSPDDPRGAGFASGFLPLALTALAAGAALALLVRGHWARFTGVLVFGVLSGTVGALVLQQWLGVLTDDYLLNAAAIGLFATAVAGTVTGLGAIAGRPGIGLAVLTVFLVGNPLSAVNAAPELLPQPWGAIGQFLPIGAGGSLLRSTAFFDGAGGAGPAWVLTAYAVVGLLLALAGAVRTRRTAPVTVPAERVPAAV